jgi:hypothetical protein
MGSSDVILWTLLNRKQSISWRANHLSHEWSRLAAIVSTTAMRHQYWAQYKRLLWISASHKSRIMLLSYQYCCVFTRRTAYTKRLKCTSTNVFIQFRLFIYLSFLPLSFLCLFLFCLHASPCLISSSRYKEHSVKQSFGQSVPHCLLGTKLILFSWRRSSWLQTRFTKLVLHFLWCDTFQISLSICSVTPEVLGF